MEDNLNFLKMEDNVNCLKMEEYYIILHYLKHLNLSYLKAIKSKTMVVAPLRVT